MSLSSIAFPVRALQTLQRSVLLAAVLLGSAVGYAEEVSSSTVTWENFDLNLDSKAPQGHWLSFGMMGGMSNYTRRDQDDARQLGFLFDYSYFTQNQSILSATFGVETFDPKQNKNYTNASLDLGYAYRFTNRLSIGPNFKTFIGDADRMSSADESFTTFVGATAQYDFAIEQNLMAVFVKYFTDINIPGRTDNSTYIGLKFAFGGAQTPVPVAQEELTLDEPEIKRPIRNLRDRLTIDAFQTGKISLPRSYEGELNDLIADLQSVQIKKIYLYGHADKIGKDPFNMSLSENRAKEVRTHFIAAGIPAEKIVIVPYGEDRPVFDRKGQYSFIKSRRVELKVVTE